MVATCVASGRLTCIMMPLERLSSAPGPDNRRPVEVRMPLQHEGIHRALKSSFGDVAEMPDDLKQLLARLR